MCEWISIAFTCQEPDPKLFLQAFPQKVAEGLFDLLPGHSVAGERPEEKGNLSTAIAVTGGFVSLYFYFLK